MHCARSWRSRSLQGKGKSAVALDVANRRRRFRDGVEGTPAQRNTANLPTTIARDLPRKVSLALALRYGAVIHGAVAAPDR